MAKSKDFDIKLIGDKALKRQLRHLGTKGQRNAIGRAFREHLRTDMVRLIYKNLSGGGGAGNSPGQITGFTRAAFGSMDVKAGKSRRGMIRIGLVWPSRDELDIPEYVPGTKSYYYPASLVYGQRPGKRRSVSVRPYPFLRPAIDSNRQSHYRKIGKRLGKQIEKEAMKHAKRLTG